MARHTPNYLAWLTVMAACACAPACGSNSILALVDGGGDAAPSDGNDAVATDATDVQADVAMDATDVVPPSDVPHDLGTDVTADADAGPIDAADALTDAPTDVPAFDTIDAVAIDVSDVGVGDAIVDVAASDVALDVAADVPVDVPVDVGVDIALDVPLDVTLDVPLDVPVDVPVDVPADLVVDAGCGATGSACALGGLAALCESGVCTPCTPVVDDAACTSAYGSASNPFECIAGSCVRGNCRTDTDCPTGEICGLERPFTCAPCASDSQCQADAHYGAGDVCNAAGQCVSGACLVAGVTCLSDTSDVCCSGACVAGNCCSSTDCLSHVGEPTCVNHVCTACDAVAAGSPTYLVDPLDGSDATGTGSGTSGGVATPACAFRSITRALAAIGSPTSATVIHLLSTAAASTTTGETYPLTIPANVTVNGTNGALSATVDVAGGDSGFVLGAPNSRLTGLIVDGASNTAEYGIVVSTGATATTVIDTLIVRNFLLDGILVTGSAVLTINAAVESTGNGTTSAPRSGMRVDALANAIVNVPTGGATTTFHDNTQHGIIVLGQGSVSITGVAGTNGAGTVVANHNQVAGLWIQQTPGSGVTIPLNSIDGLVTHGAIAGNGMHFFAGSNVRVRNSYSTANAVNGVYVSADALGATTLNDVSTIDLGGVGAPGRNTFQVSAPSAAGDDTQNASSGVCLDLGTGATGTLAAQGNIFAGPTNCLSATGPIHASVGACAGQTDVGTTRSGTAIDTTMCTQGP